MPFLGGGGGRGWGLWKGGGRRREGYGDVGMMLYDVMIVLF